jgi:hypothetical protein
LSKYSGIEQATPVMKQVTPVMKQVPSISDVGPGAGPRSRARDQHRLAVVAGTRFGESHATAVEASAVVVESLQCSATGALEAVGSRALVRFALLSSGDVSSQRSKTPCLIALGPSFR